MDTEVLSIPAPGWEESKSVSEGSVNTSNEQMALVGFAYQLSSSIMSNDGIADEIDVRKEAELLMSLSCTSPTIIMEQSGRITPPSDASSCHSSSSGRGSFCFTCPSLSLENHSRGLEEDSGVTEATADDSTPPSELLGRSLKMDDRDALRLSSEAMARNIMLSYKKAIDWRIQSWGNSLSRILVDKEQAMIETNASEDKLRELLKSGEARLLLKLRELSDQIKVLDACTAFKVLPQRVSKEDGSEPPTKKQRLSGEAAAGGLEESEYQYQVAHVTALEGYLNIQTPAGHVQVEIHVPGSMKGTFLSAEEDVEELTDVKIELNTEILSAMIEKSSRKVVRASVEALLKGEPTETAEEEKQTLKEGRPVENNNERKLMTKSPTSDKPLISTCTPQRIVSEDRVAGLVLITPARDTSSPLSYGDSDNDEKPVLLSIPDDFKQSNTTNLRMLTPQPSRPRDRGSFTFTSQYKDKSLPTVVTPHKTHTPEHVTSLGKGPILPLLVEVACAAMRKN